jgi:hypothetical protein
MRLNGRKSSMGCVRISAVTLFRAFKVIPEAADLR